MEFAVEARSPRAKEFLEHMIPEMIEQLGLARYNKALLVRVERKVDEENSDGVTVPLPGLNAIVVAVRSTRDLTKLGATVAHEMVHVKQIASGKLKTVKSKIQWNGKLFKASTPYLSRPWEVEAFQRQELIFRRAIERHS
jgi:hypothetical protein